MRFIKSIALLFIPLLAAAQTTIPTGPNGPVAQQWTGIPMNGDCTVDATAKITCPALHNLPAVPSLGPLATLPGPNPALPNGTTGTTQAVDDQTQLLATDAMLWAVFAQYYGVNAVTQGGLVPNNPAVDNGPLFAAMVAKNCTGMACVLFLPCAKYYAPNGVTLPMTNGQYTGMRIYSAGRAGYTGNHCVSIVTTNPDACGFWMNNTSNNAGNQGGPIIEGINVTDSGGNATCGFRFTQINRGLLIDVSTNGFKGTTGYSTGTLTVTYGSKTASCTGCALTADMAHGFLFVLGKLQEIQSVQQTAAGWQINLMSDYTIGPSGSYTKPQWNIDHNGMGLMFDGGSGFAQYWTIVDYHSYGNRVGIDFAGGPASGNACPVGNSRYDILGGSQNGEGIAGSVGIYGGRCTDTIYNGIAQNNYAFPEWYENSHANHTHAKNENKFVTTGDSVAVPSCPAGSRCDAGWTLNCEATNECQDNVINDAYIQEMSGAGIQVINDQLVQGMQILGTTLRGNTQNLKFSSGKSCNTQTAATIHEPDCDATQAPGLSVNGVCVAGVCTK